MNIKSTSALLLLVFFFAGCSTMKTTSERDPDYAFDKIQTYQWIDGPAEVLDEDDTYLNEDIQKALNQELVNSNWRQVLDAAEADVQIAYYVKLKEHHEYTAPANRDERDFSGGLVYSRETSSWSYQEREPDLNVYAVEIGTLTVLLYDTATGERVWRGTLKTRLDRSLPKDRQQERIRAAAEKIMSRIP
jgi:hypothetical protein